MNRYYPHTIIAQEGWTFIIGGVVVSVIIMLLCGWWSLPFWLATLFMLNFFRDPARNIPEAPDAILSPADGRVVVVEKAVDPYRNVETLKISIFMNVFDVHSQRAPARGKITDVRYTAGKKLNAALDKASSENERNAVLMTTASGREITFVQIAGLVARRILCYVNKGDSLVRGERYGFIRFGSRVDVYLPLDANPNVAIGDKVRATETILAFLPLEQDPNFDPNQVEISSHISPAARLKADKDNSERKQHDDLDAQIRERVAAQFQQENPSNVAPNNNIAKEELEVAARLAKIQAERQAEAAERERILAQEAAEAEEVRQRIAQEEAAEREAQKQAQLKAEQEAKAEAERIAAEEARIKAEQAAKAEAEQARLKAEQAAKAEAERIVAEQARLKAEREAEAKRIEQEQAQAAEQARIQAAEQAKAQAERLAEQARAQLEQARLQAEQAAKAEAERIAQEQARLQAEQAAKAEAERIAKEQARLQAEQAAKAEAERIAQEQARLQAEQAAKAEAERIAKEQARLQAEQAAKAEAERIAKEQARLQAEQAAKAEAERLAQEQARLQAEQAAKAEAEKLRQTQASNSFRRAEEKALAEIAAREPIVRRETFASVPEPWQTIEPSEVVIKVDDK